MISGKYWFHFCKLQKWNYYLNLQPTYCKTNIYPKKSFHSLKTPKWNVNTGKTRLLFFSGKPEFAHINTLKLPFYP
jgi:hypothetical protein